MVKVRKPIPGYAEQFAMAVVLLAARLAGYVKNTLRTLPTAT